MFFVCMMPLSKHRTEQHTEQVASHELTKVLHFTSTNYHTGSAPKQVVGAKDRGW